jgi:hypothetical protein
MSYNACIAQKNEAFVEIGKLPRRVRRERWVNESTVEEHAFASHGPEWRDVW